MFFFLILCHNEPYHLLDTTAFQRIRICSRFCAFPVFQRICLFLWLIFAQHGLFEIQLTVYSALSRLTVLGIYDITRCGIWLLTIFNIPYIHFQREMSKITSPKWYLSFFFSLRIIWIHRLSFLNVPLMMKTTTISDVKECKTEVFDWQNINISAAYFIVRTDKIFKISWNDWHVQRFQHLCDYNVINVLEMLCIYSCFESLPWEGGCTWHCAPPPPPAESASADQIPDSAFNMAVNHLFYWLNT